jgi:hypothetical protein
MPEDTADRLMEKVRAFSADLADDERAMFAALLAPGIARALDPGPEVEGFGITSWLPTSLPEGLERAVRERDIRVEGL